MYIIIEGIDTCGKSTQIELLKEKYPKAIFTKEPGGTTCGVTIRKLILEHGLKSKTAEMFLFLADRAEHYEEIVKPNRDNLVISDRGFVSGIGYAISLDMQYLIGLNILVLQNNLPEKVIFLKLSEEELSKRLSTKTHDKIESRGISYLMQIQERIETVIKKMNLNAIILDASQNIDEIQIQINKFLEE